MVHSHDKHGLVFNIQKFSLHDGDGIRTLVFLKGCPLCCRWCSNPEGQSFVPELAYNPDKCIGITECGRCIEACDKKAVAEGSNGKAEIDIGICRQCSEFRVDCPSKAMIVYGQYMTVDEVIKKVEEDGVFYKRSSGGLTVGGGEPLSQCGFTTRLVKEARSRGIDTAMETSGFADWKHLEQICPHLNQIFYDIKLMDSKRHEDFTGVSNQLILENFLKVCKKFPELEITVRTPVVPGFSDSLEDIMNIVGFLNCVSRNVSYELLPYHGFGVPKYHLLGRKYSLDDIHPLYEDQFSVLKQAVAKKLVHCLVCRT